MILAAARGKSPSPWSTFNRQRNVCPSPLVGSQRIAMDPVSAGASIIAFVQIANTVISACKFCIDTIKDAPKDMHMIFGEVTSLKATMESLDVADMHATATSIEACHRCLSELSGLLPRDYDASTKGKNRKITMMELAWPLKQSKARRLLSEISHHKSTLLLAISGDMVSVFSSANDLGGGSWLTRLRAARHHIKDIKAGVVRVEQTMTGMPTTCYALYTLKADDLINQTRNGMRFFVGWRREIRRLYTIKH
jgi:hypothetical protein